jgi:hypothetical protein
MVIICPKYEFVDDFKIKGQLRYFEVLDHKYKRVANGQIGVFHINNYIEPKHNYIIRKVDLLDVIITENLTTETIAHYCYPWAFEKETK